MFDKCVNVLEFITLTCNVNVLFIHVCRAVDADEYIICGHSNYYSHGQAQTISYDHKIYCLDGKTLTVYMSQTPKSIEYYYLKYQ